MVTGIPYDIMHLVHISMSKFIMSWKPLIGAALALSAVLGTTHLSAQDSVVQEIQRLTGRSVTTEEVIDGLRRSGLSRAEVGQRLRQQGLDASLADQYFDVLEGQAEDAPAPAADFLAALELMGMISVEAGETALGASVADVVQAQDTTRAPAENAGLAVFGKEVFGSASTRFDPLRMGPVAPNYRLGPEDQIRLILTGDVELAYTPTVTREGFIVIPDVGQVFVNGLTLSDLENTLYDRLGRVYSGVRRGSGATTFFNVSLGNLRTNQVFLIGEMESPGAYQVSSVASTFNALYGAGGPTSIGSFREVLVRRGGDTVATVDLYDYLLTGDVSDDVRLEQGDVVFVPLAGPQVRVTGEVRRSAIYELRAGEGLRAAIRFAGGLAAEGDPERILIDRVIPSAERRGQVQRRILTVSLAALPADSSITLRDGDVIRVFGIRDMRRDRVTLQGPVLRPGDYELLPGMTVWDLIRQAGGLLPDAFRSVAHVSRLNESDSTRTLTQVSLQEDQSGASQDDLELVDQDLVRVFANTRLSIPMTVGVLGLVKDPGTFPLARGMTAEDLILLAGGFTGAADGLAVEVVRPLPGMVRTDTISVTLPLSLSGRIPWRLEETSGPTGADAATFILEDGDRLFVRPLPGFVEVESIRVSGEILRPGDYGFQRRREHVSDLIRRAGGLTVEAYVAGAQLVREGVPVALDLGRALQQPGGEYDLLVHPGDLLSVPPYVATVLVRGAVRVESRVPFLEGLSLGDYVARAGGTGDRADRWKAYVQYANGSLDVSSKFLFFKTDPRIQPGSTIVVPTKEEGDEGFQLDQFLTRTITILGSLATVWIAADRIGRN